MTSGRLATVVRIRELAERRRLAELGTARRTVRAADAALEAALTARDHERRGAVERITPIELAARRTAHAALDDRVVLAGQELVLAARATDRAQARLLDAAVERRSVERLAARRAETARRYAARRQQHRDDDVALMTRRRRS